MDFKKFRIGNSSEINSKLGYGCWGIGGGTKELPSYGEIDADYAIHCLLEAKKKKVNFFDTSPAYGESEKIIGSFLQKIERTEVCIATKCGINSFNSEKNFSESKIISQIENSLYNLKTNFIDLIQIHNPDVFFLKNINYFNFLSEKKKSGEIKGIGISLKSPSDFFLIPNYSIIDSIQINFNILDTRMLELGIHKICKDNKISIISRTPFGFGFLTGRISEKKKFPENDHRKYWNLKQTKKWIKLSKEIFKKLKKNNITQPQFCLNFCMSFPFVSLVIPGMMTKEEIKENAQVLQMNNFSEEEINQIIEINNNSDIFEK